MQRSRVVVIIPIYKIKLNPLEEISLYQVFSILGKQYKICFVIPDNVQFSFLMEPDCVEKFDSRFFKSTESYSELLLSVEFYQRFGFISLTSNPLTLIYPVNEIPHFK